MSKVKETKPFTFIDLFAGIGGFRRGLEAIGGTCVFSSEIDKFAAQAYEALYGEKPHGDITKIDAKDIPDHDVLAGGFPCQSFSVAGKRGGFEDARGTLFFEIARIAAEKQPKVLLLENVKGLVGHDKGKTLDTIVKTLNDIGYRVDFDVLNSKYFGVPQNRERIFIVGVREDLVENEPWENVKGATVVPKGKRRISGYDDVKTFNFDWPTNDSVTTRLRDILETEVDEKYYLDEEKTAELVAQLEEKDKTVGTVGHHPFSKKYEFKGYNSEISPSLIATDYKAPKTVLETEPQMLGHGVVEKEEVRPVLTPDRMEKRQNGRRFKEDGEESFTLTTQDQHGVALGERHRYRIRKLTPLECFRLQNFPDEAHQKLVEVGISDSQRYKMAGNAVTVSVVEAIGERLMPLIADT